MATGNTKYGDGALENNTTNTSPAGANNNSAFGIGALQNSTNYWNTAVGAYSGNSTTTGISNSSLGVNALLKNTTGSYNTALGTASMCFNETGNNNTSVGSNALENNTANENTAIGSGALFTNTLGYSNTAIGFDALNANTTGTANVAVGIGSLLNNTTADLNTAVGSASLRYNITGGRNTAVGAGALELNTAGEANVAMGVHALQKNTVSNNTAIGYYALEQNTSGSENTALGTQAGYTNSGNQNTFLGAQTDASGIYSKSTAIGYNSKVTASNQIMMGTSTEQVVIPGSALLTNTDPNSYSSETSIVPKSYVDSIASGLKPTSACKCATIENITTLSGYLTIDGYPTTDGDRVLVKNQGAISDENTNNINNGIYVASSGAWSRASDCDVGDDVQGQLTYIESGTTNNFKAFSQISDPAIVGTNALQYALFYSTSFSLGNGLELSGSTLNVKDSLTGFLDFVGINGGTNTAYSIDTGTKDALIHGIKVGLGSGSVASNTAVGYQSLNSNTTGPYNTAVGYQALLSNTTAKDNTAVGYFSLKANIGGGSSTTGINNTAVGSNALVSNASGSYNVAIGAFSLRDNNGSFNVAVGDASLLYNSNGAYNIGVGAGTLGYNTSGQKNTAIGNAALEFNTTGQYNTAVGFEALKNTLGIGTGNNNTALGYLAGKNLTIGSNVTCIGYDAQPSSASVNNEITLGNMDNSTVLRCGTNTITTTSDCRDKKDIQELAAGLNFVEQLKPVSFTWNMRDGGKVDIPDTGFIAQDLKQVQIDTGINIPGLVYEENPERIEASYGKLLPVLVKAIQDLKKEVDELKAQIKQ